LAVLVVSWELEVRRGGNVLFFGAAVLVLLVLGTLAALGAPLAALSVVFLLNNAWLARKDIL